MPNQTSPTSAASRQPQRLLILTARIQAMQFLAMVRHGLIRFELIPLEPDSGHARWFRP
jgi:hypothetical protein